ncbi:hypothetical protein HanPSC8_Chr16g0726291 [Helianthus annuus]|nr:hypothetical protein HanPSC8_Chr16g0726291 [Helianthus annuus]
MESSDDEKDHVNEKSTGNESTPTSANGTKISGWKNMCSINCVTS